MTEDVEERFKRACSAYLADVEHAERQRERAAEAALEAESARLAADRSRDALVLVVRERDVTAQLAAAGPPVPVIAVIDAAGRDTGATIVGVRITPSPQAQAAADAFRARYVTPDEARGYSLADDAAQQYDERGRPVIDDD